MLDSLISHGYKREFCSYHESAVLNFAAIGATK